MADAFDSDDESASAHELTELDLQEIYHGIMQAPAGTELLLHTTRASACHRASPKPSTPQPRQQQEETNPNRQLIIRYQQGDENIFQYLSAGLDRAIDPRRADEERQPSIMGLLFSLINKIWSACTTLIVGIFFVLPLFILACITTTTAIGFLMLLIFAKGLSDGGHRFMEWWFSHDSRRLVYVPAERPRKGSSSAARDSASAQGQSSSRHGSGAGSQSSNGTPSRSNRSNSSASLSSMPNPNRDYEGVGGWKTDVNESGDQAIFMNLNSNSALELSNLGSPSSRRRRSFGASSVISTSGVNSPELINTPLYGRSNASGSLRRMSGTGSPQSYFSAPLGGGSGTLVAASSTSRRSSRVLVLERGTERTERGTGDEGTDGEEAVV